MPNPTPPALREALIGLYPRAEESALWPKISYNLERGRFFLAFAMLDDECDAVAHPRLADVAVVAGALGLCVDGLDTPTLIRRFVGDPMCLTISDKGWSGMGKFPPQGWNPDETKALVLALLTANATKAAQEVGNG